MADLMNDLKAALADVNTKKKVFETATLAVQNASNDYQHSVDVVQKLRTELNELVNSQLLAVGISPSDPRVTQSN
jgi:hypothetical protein